MSTRKQVTATCPGQVSQTVWDALCDDARVSDPSVTYDVRRSTFEFTTEDDPAAILSRSVFQICNVQWSVADA